MLHLIIKNLACKPHSTLLCVSQVRSRRAAERCKRDAITQTHSWIWNKAPYPGLHAGLHAACIAGHFISLRNDHRSSLVLPYFEPPVVLMFQSVQIYQAASLHTVSTCHEVAKSLAYRACSSVHMRLRTHPQPHQPTSMPVVGQALASLVTRLEHRSLMLQYIGAPV